MKGNSGLTATTTHCKITFGGREMKRPYGFEYHGKILRKWRPPGWEEVVSNLIDESNKQATVDLSRRSLIEAGADAILEALQAEPAVRLNNKWETPDQFIIKVKDLPDGIWRVLLVPELEEKDENYLS